MPQLTYRQYWEMISKQAKSKASKEVGLVWRIVTATITVISSITAYVLVTPRGKINMETILIYIVGGLVGAICWFLIWFVYFLWHRAYEPVIEHNKQEGQKAQLESDKKDLQDKLNPSEIKLTVLHYFSPKNDKASILVWSPQRVTNLRVEMIQRGLTRLTNGTELPYVDKQISMANREFSEGDRFFESKTIFKEDFIFIHIAEIVDDKLVWLLNSHFVNEAYDTYSNGQMKAVFNLDLLVEATYQNQDIKIQQTEHFLIYFESHDQDIIGNPAFIKERISTVFINKRIETDEAESKETI